MMTGICPSHIIVVLSKSTDKNTNLMERYTIIFKMVNITLMLMKREGSLARKGSGISHP